MDSRGLWFQLNTQVILHSIFRIYLVTKSNWIKVGMDLVIHGHGSESTVSVHKPSIHSFVLYGIGTDLLSGGSNSGSEPVGLGSSRFRFEIGFDSDF